MRATRFKKIRGYWRGRSEPLKCEHCGSTYYEVPGVRVRAHIKIIEL